MQRIMNDPDNIVDEMLEGFLKVHADIVEQLLSEHFGGMQCCGDSV